MKYLVFSFLCLLLIAPVNAWAQEERMCFNNLNIEEVENPEKLQAVFDFFVEVERHGSVPLMVPLEMAVEMVEYLRSRGFRTAGIRISEGKSHWWKFPLLGVASAGSSLTMHTIVWMVLNEPFRIPESKARMLAWVPALAAGVGIFVLLDTQSDVGKKSSFSCELLWQD